MITVHHLSTSHSHVILWLLEELGEPYEIVQHQREPSGRAPDSLRAIHPAGKSPTVEDLGLVMIESTGIILYILDAYGNGRLRPAPHTREAMQFFQWLTYVEGSAKGPLVQLLRAEFTGADEAALGPLKAMASAPAALIDAELAGRETIVPGLLTAADLQLAFYEEILDSRGQLDAWPNMAAHLGRMRSRDAYQRALEKGGPVRMVRPAAAGAVGRG